MEELLPSYNAQRPEYRVRLQMLWQVLLRAGTTLFLDRAESFLSSKNIRYYYKCTVWEALGQIEAPGEKIIAFIQARDIARNRRASVTMLDRQRRVVARMDVSAEMESRSYAADGLGECDASEMR